jgi:hypothetical protein
VRACLACSTRITPPGVLAPYRRDGQAPARQVKSQRESDLEALDLAGRKGVMLAQLRAVADDDRLHPESLPKIEWFAEQVKGAKTDARLDELAGLLGEAGIRRRRWWQGQPAAITAGYSDEDGEPDEYGDDGDQGAPGLRPVPETRAPLADYSAEMAMRQWRWQPHGVQLCGLIHMTPHGWHDMPPEECMNRAAVLIAGGAICESCRYALSQPMRRT